MKRHLEININYLIVHIRLARLGTLGVVMADFIPSPGRYKCLKKLSAPTEASPVTGAIITMYFFISCPSADVDSCTANKAVN